MPTKSRKKPPSDRLLAAIQAANGDWVGRRDIAIAIKSKNERLNPHHVLLLQRMIDAGTIEVDRRPRPGSIGYELIYRAKESK